MFFLKLAAFLNVHDELCVFSLCWSLSAATIVKMSVAAHPGRQEAIHREIGNPTSEEKVQKSNSQKSSGRAHMYPRA